MALAETSVIDEVVRSTAARESPVLELTDVTLHVIAPDGGRLKIVDRVSFSVGPSRFFALIG